MFVQERQDLSSLRHLRQIALKPTHGGRDKFHVSRFAFDQIEKIEAADYFEIALYSRQSVDFTKLPARQATARQFDTFLEIVVDQLFFDMRQDDGIGDTVVQ